MPRWLLQLSWGGDFASRVGSERLRASRRYVTFDQGDNLTLQIGGVTSKIYNAVLPSNLTLFANGNALMTLQIEVENPNNLSGNMTVNGTTIMSFTHSRDRFGAIQEVFPANILHVGANNVTVRVVSGQGRLRVSDFALHFQALVGNP